MFPREDEDLLILKNNLIYYGIQNASKFKDNSFGKEYEENFSEFEQILETINLFKTKNIIAYTGIVNKISNKLQC